jgi:hypothetical protein
LKWSDAEWVSLLKTQGDDYETGIPDSYFQYPDTSHADPTILVKPFSDVVNRNGILYVLLVFKYWDESMSSHAFGVTEHCVFFYSDLTANHSCGRNRNFLEKEHFSHKDVVK